MVSAHPIHRVVRVPVVAPYTLELSFEDGISRVIDFLPVLEGELYGPLRDQSLFDRVALDAEAQTIVWPNGADFDPATLHDWPDLEAEMLSLASRWREQRRSVR